MLGPRLLTGGLLIAALAGVVVLDGVVERRAGPPGAVIGALVLLVLAPLLALELARMLRSAGAMVPTPLAIIAAVGGLVATTGVPGMPEPGRDTAPIALVLLAIVAFIAAAAQREPRGSAAIVGGTLLAFVVAGVMPGFWLKVRVDFSAELFVACVLVVKSSDIGAYFGGRLFGRHKLIPWLSPAKTREGVVAGVLLSALVAALFAISWREHPWMPTPTTAALGGAILAVVGVLGDLGESLLKREAGVKDSGRVLPGMGGLFDVLDSLLPAGAVAWLMLRL